MCQSIYLFIVCEFLYLERGVKYEGKKNNNWNLSSFITIYTLVLTETFIVKKNTREIV